MERTPTGANSSRSQEFDAVITYLKAASVRLPRGELLEIANMLDELVRLKQGKPRAKMIVDRLARFQR